jgi:hypothetical protein
MMKKLVVSLSALSFVAIATIGCGTPQAELPPPTMTKKLPPMSPADARAISGSFLNQLEKMPPPMRKSFAAKHARGTAAIKALGDDQVTARYQADIAGK